MRRVLWLVGMLYFGALWAGGDPSALYLTWVHDPTTTMTVQWLSEELSSRVLYHKVGGEEWHEKEGIYTSLKNSKIVVHAVELDGLEPGAAYEFQLKGGDRTYRFKTLPQELNRPVRFVVGGDVYKHLSTFRKMNEQVAALDPDFVVVGGDIAYTINNRAVFKGKGWELNRWRQFFKEWKSQMVTSDGFLIPIIPVMGNHDIRHRSLVEKHEHFLYYELFALPEKGVSYRTFDAGEYLSLFILDSGHSFHIEGQQTEWLEKALAQRQGVLYKMAAYHVGAYPTAYAYDGATPKRIRYYWSPLFERYQLQVAFEHHNHAYKRTFPMKRGKVDPEGVIYMGDGCWGVSPRKPKEMWYLEKKAGVNHVCCVTLSLEEAKVEAIDIKGEMIDFVEILPEKGTLSLGSGRLLECH